MHSSLQARRGSPVPLQGTIAAQLRFTEYSLGSFHAWHARGIPSSGAESVWRVVHSRGQARGLTALLGPDEEFNDTYYEQFLLPDGRLTPVKPISFDAALAARRKVLGPSAELLRLALLRATPDPAGPGANVPSTGTQSLTVFAASPEEVAALLVLGDGREPSPEELVAALRHFRVRYGVALLAASAYSVEFVAERPPKEVAALRELAGWFVLFCPAALVRLDHILETPRIGALWATGLQHKGQTPIQRMRRACRRRQTSARVQWGDWVGAGGWSARLRGSGLFWEGRFF